MRLLVCAVSNAETSDHRQHVITIAIAISKALYASQSAIASIKHYSLTVNTSTSYVANPRYSTHQNRQSIHNATNNALEF